MARSAIHPSAGTIFLLGPLASIRLLCPSKPHFEPPTINIPAPGNQQSGSTGCRGQLGLLLESGLSDLLGELRYLSQGVGVELEFGQSGEQLLVERIVDARLSRHDPGVAA